MYCISIVICFFMSKKIFMDSIGIELMETSQDILCVLPREDRQTMTIALTKARLNMNSMKNVPYIYSRILRAGII